MRSAKSSRAAFVRVFGAAGAVMAAGCSGHPEPEPVVAGQVIERTGPRVNRSEPIKPPRLKPGDCVGIVACGSPARKLEEIQRAKDNLALLGLVPVTASNLFETNGYLAGSDLERAEQFNGFVRDEQIRAIIALRGGYGAMRILDSIDYDALVRDPKIVVGFSDVTAILNAITVRTGLVTFHGPVAGHGIYTEAVLAGLRRALMQTEPIGAIASNAGPAMFPSNRSASGVIYGGNLSIIASLCGTDYQIPAKKTILLLEDVNEAPYRIDRMLTQLRLSGLLETVSAVGLGQFVHCVVNADVDDLPSFTIEQTIQDRLGDLKCPIVAGLPFGHIATQTTLPIGINALADTRAGVISIAEAAVS